MDFAVKTQVTNQGMKPFLERLQTKVQRLPEDPTSVATPFIRVNYMDVDGRDRTWEGEETVLADWGTDLLPYLPRAQALSARFPLPTAHLDNVLKTFSSATPQNIELEDLTAQLKNLRAEQARLDALIAADPASNS
ncbi:hypothetical protein PMZ80_005591 [Knufia obscura]|uniref:Uncharacterized protein n=2 Tax=Knufia TaxID=430999 RepID=A0AAN8EAG7_9EURO|nr:hypothetical protein PMZ80_005591 [Knufia obscura]KAK5950058.1 hypothetical protein OHC33_009020 [Knufia fluminis]